MHAKQAHSRLHEDSSKGSGGERIFVGKYWRTGRTIIVSPGGVGGAATIRRAGAHRRWDAEGLPVVRGVPWSWHPEAEVQPGDLRVRFQTERELQEGGAGERSRAEILQYASSSALGGGDMGVGHNLIGGRGHGPAMPSLEQGMNPPSGQVPVRVIPDATLDLLGPIGSDALVRSEGFGGAA